MHYFVVIFMGILGASSITYADGMGTACVGCHPGTVSRKFLHPPTKDKECDSCHDIQAEHLTTQKKEFVTTNRSNDSCYGCHDRMDSNPYVHTALKKEESCIKCHSPHGSDVSEYFTRELAPQLCTKCHTKLLPPETGVQHGAVKSDRSCLNCHNPHSSPKAKLLTGKGANCFICHYREMDVKDSSGTLVRTIPNMKKMINELPMAHDPATSGSECVECHNPHGSRFTGMIKDQGVLKASWNSNITSTCLNCHGDLVSNEFVSASDTNFRNDVNDAEKITRKNLHFSHVVTKEKACTACHDVHGGLRPHNIASMPFSRPRKKFDFIVTQEGGTCNHACHGNANYSRIK